MALILLPIFFLSLACTVYGFLRVRNKVKLSVIVFSGLPVLGIAFPVTVVVINSLLGGMIESRMNLLWSFVKLITIDRGDIYMGAGGLILAVIAIVLLYFKYCWCERSKLQHRIIENSSFGVQINPNNDFKLLIE